LFYCPLLIYYLFNDSATILVRFSQFTKFQNNVLNFQLAKTPNNTRKNPVKPKIQQIQILTKVHNLRQRIERLELEAIQ